MHLIKPMNKIYKIIFLLLFVTGCNEKNVIKKRTFSDYYDDKNALITKTPNSDKKAEYVIDCYYGMNKKDFDSLIQKLKKEKLIEIKPDNSINLIVNNEESVYGRDSFELKTHFENDSLKFMSCFLIQGYFPKYSKSQYLDDYKLLFSTKYGEPKLSFFSEYIPISRNEIYKTRTSYSQYYYWIKDNLCIGLSESGYSEVNSNSNKERRSLFITYSSLKFEKQILKRTKLKEEVELNQERQKKIEKQNRTRKEDSLKSVIF